MKTFNREVFRTNRPTVQPESTTMENEVIDTDDFLESMKDHEEDTTLDQATPSALSAAGASRSDPAADSVDQSVNAFSSLSIHNAAGK